MPEQPVPSMDEILSDKEPVKSESGQEPVAKEPIHIPVFGEKPAEPKPEPKPQSSKQAWQDKEQAAKGLTRDPETGQFTKTEEAKPEAKPETKPETKPEAKPAAPQQEFTDKEKAFMRGMEEERRKRQELERRLAALEPAKPAASTEPAKSFWDDPDAALAKQTADLQAETARIRGELIVSRLNTSEALARQKHPQDFDEKIVIFGNLLKENPVLYQQWMAAPDPAEFAYSTGSNYQALQEAGGIAELKEKIEKETRIRLEAELKEKAEKLAAERAALPPSLSEAKSTGVNRPTWGGPPSMDDILKG